MKKYDDCLSAIKELNAEFSRLGDNQINEDTTRLRFIDTLLFECLDWDKFTQCETEDKEDFGIIDYSLSPQGTLLVVEAKKTGVSFALPCESTSRRTGLVRSLDGVMSLDKRVKAAIQQVAHYALEKGAPFAAVSNGWQFIAFSVRSTPGISWKEGKALVFESLQSIQDNFLEFWNALSAEGVKSFNLLTKLNSSFQSQRPPRKSDNISNYNKTKNRNSFQADLQIIGDLIFGGGVFRDRALFQSHCYCLSGALPQFSQASRKYLEDRYPDFFADTGHAPKLESATTKKGVAEALLNLTNINKPIILLGDVGVGKSTFIEHLFIVEWADKINNLIVIRIDLADKPSRPSDLAETVREQIDQSLQQNYGINIQDYNFLKGVYNKEVQRHMKSPEGVAVADDVNESRKLEAQFLRGCQQKFDEHLRSVFSHLVRAQGKMIVLVFDNVDQRDVELQAATFIQAQIAASTWDVFSILALRPETFVRSISRTSMSGYHPRAFTISPPRFDLLITKRIDAAIKMLDGELPIPALGRDIKTLFSNAKGYLEVLKHSFKKNPDLIGFCEDMSGGNMRRALDYIIQFMSCGHVDSEKILDKWSREGKYVIPLHEFIRGVMFSDREYYSSDSSNVVNVYNCVSSDTREPFAVLSVLYILADVAEEVISEVGGHGFMLIDELKRRLTLTEFLPPQVDWILNYCLENGFLETNLKSSTFDESTHVRLTSIGAYYYKKLVRTFVYNDAVCLDTPILDSEVRFSIKDVNYIPGRLDRVSIFIDYLDRLYAKHPSLNHVSSWSEISEGIKSDIATVRDNYDRSVAKHSQSVSSE